MATVIASGKRFGLILFSVLTLGQTTATAPVLRWAASWWLNRSSIMVLASVNTAITAASELVSRELLAQGSNNSDQRFFIRHDDGRLAVHRQSLVNIFMTILASLLGGPIYFIRKRWNRFMFFISFGAMNSASSQMLAHLAYDGTIVLSLGRFAFDLFYNGTLKFWMFEFARPAILRFRKSLVGVGTIRVTQDFLTTLFRVGMLNWFGFK